MSRDKMIAMLEADAVPEQGDDSIRKYLEEESTSTAAEAPKNAGDSEAIQAAVAKVREKRSSTGKIWGAGKHKEEPYKRATAQMKLFAGHVLKGMPAVEAYRAVYDCRIKTDAQVARDANKTLKLEAVQRLLEAGGDTALEMLIDDMVAARRFVMRELIGHATKGKAETTQLKALELMGRAVGMYTDKVEQKTEAVDVGRLKEELRTHLALVDQPAKVEPIKKRSA